jgi:DNA-binding MarR family transcriptional regulator
VTGLDTEFESADQSTGLALWRVTNAWQAAQRAALKPFDITHVQFVLLASLAYLDRESITQADLASHAGTDPMMTSQVLRALEAKGLVSRRPHPTDGRARVLSTTAAGTAMANRAVREVERCDRDFFRVLPDQRGFTAQLMSLVR